MLQALIMGLVQGLTEFLPISSSGHLLLLGRLPFWHDQGLMFDAFLHLGTLAAVVWFFRKDLLQLIQGVIKKDERALKLAGLILIGIIPAGVVGWFAQDAIETTFRTASIVIFDFIFWGIILGLADWYLRKKGAQTNDIHKVSYTQSFIIGLAQILAFFPGTSRSGITMTAAMSLRIDRPTAARFSFIMSIPLIAAAGLLSLLDITGGVQSISPAELIVGFLASFAAGLLAISGLLKLLMHRGFGIFVWYRIIFGLILLLLMF